MLRPRRSVLYLPASNARAIEKARELACDALILDLEDAVAPETKPSARAAAAEAVRAGGFGRREVAIRVNAMDTPWSEADFAAAVACGVDAVVVPKIGTPEDAARAVRQAAGRPVWAMIETPRGVLAADAIAATEGIAALVAGTNDLAKELRATPGCERLPLLHSLSTILLAARAHDRIALDGVHNDIHDLDGLTTACVQGAAMGFDGKTLIHPGQIEAANQAFAPDAQAVEAARGLIAAYEAALVEGRGVISHQGRMVEQLHVETARRLIAFAEAIGLA